AAGALGGRHADPDVALAAEQRGALAGEVAQLGQNGLGDREEAVLARGDRELGEPRTQDEPPLRVAVDEAVVLERDGQPVGGGAGQPGRLDELGEGSRARLQRVQNADGFVKYADSARVVHVLILPSRILRCKFRVARTAARRGAGRGSSRPFKQARWE